MIDFEKMRQEKTVVIFSQRIAEKLVFRYGLRNLIAIEKSNRDERRKVYIFFNFPELVDEFQQMVEDLKWLENERCKTEQDYYNISDKVKKPGSEIVEPEPTEETISSVNDSDLLPEDDGKPKAKRGRKKKSNMKNELQGEHTEIYETV
ncbi:hypothetical protein [Sinanaerobacter chloroacetimidivorans]|uniref:Uncharacterized protein n=1 Tax=Sinanaerobacter chloroacetimidivorans TaxID=2818044 RepID=A0A8J8B289_9FIRM|nr:hypothetical protein [Sinanaerobacter chloroacetimidivorans]MBR0599034.1 hypothetical protein [Sinanaerobacter chloroacetimidivorans]